MRDIADELLLRFERVASRAQRDASDDIAENDRCTGYNADDDHEIQRPDVLDLRYDRSAIEVGASEVRLSRMPSTIADDMFVIENAERDHDERDDDYREQCL